MKGVGPALVSVLAVGLLGAQGAPPSVDLVGIRVLVRTTAVVASVSLVDASLAVTSGALVAGPASARTTIDGSRLLLFGNLPGQPAEGEFRLIVVDPPADVVTWTVEMLGRDASTTVEVYSLGDEPSQLVDRFESRGGGEAFTTHVARLRSDDSSIPPVKSRLVLAHYYPWFEQSTWDHPWLRDRPLRPYSTEVADDVARVLEHVQRATLDGLTISWQGKHFQGGWNHRRTRILLDEAQRAHLKVAALLETTVANPSHDQDGAPADPNTVFLWLRQIVDLYGRHPAYLRVRGRPVVFVYAVPRLRVDQWRSVVRRLRASGRNPLLIGDATRAVWLESMDGAFDYASNRFTRREIGPFDREQSLLVRAYHLLGAAFGRRRIWAATVSPGYDDRLLADGRVPRHRRRASGAYYAAQWSAALAADADWVLITSWNEWWENTHIEPSVRYGHRYVNLTRTWAARFRRAASTPIECRETLTTGC